MNCIIALGRVLKHVHLCRCEPEEVAVSVYRDTRLDDGGPETFCFSFLARGQKGLDE